MENGEKGRAPSLDDVMRAVLPEDMPMHPDHPMQQAEPAPSKYSDVVSDGGMDPRNAPAPAQTEQKPVAIPEAVRAWMMDVPLPDNEYGYRLTNRRDELLAAPIAQPAMTAELRQFGTEDWQVHWVVDSGDASMFGRPLYFRNFKVGDKVQLYAAPVEQTERVSVPVGLLQDLVANIEDRTCTHDSTHRGGAIWEICDDCGDRWADDRGGKPKFKWPDCVEKSRALLASYAQTEPGPAQDEREARALFEEMALIADDERCVQMLAAALAARPAQTERHPIRLPSPPYMPGVEPESMTDYERGEAQGRCDMWEEVKRLNAAPIAQAAPLRYTNDGELAECPCCGSLDVGGAHDTVHCYRCGLTVTKPRPLQNAMGAWNMRTGKQTAPQGLRIVFDGPPGPEAGRFVEAENAEGSSVNAGEWRQRTDGLWELVLHPAAPQQGVQLADTRRSRIYLAGPMTGIADYNFPAFNAEADRLREQGYHVENPADHGVVEGADWADYLRYDIGRLATCECIHLLPGWSQSSGAKLEVSIAKALGMHFLYAEGAETAPQPEQSGLVEAVTPEIIDWVRCGLSVNGRLVDGTHPALEKLCAAYRAALSSTPSPAKRGDA